MILLSWRRVSGIGGVLDTLPVFYRLSINGKQRFRSRSVLIAPCLDRFTRFRTVLLDFDGVEFVGQAFADEVFRVFAVQHPDMEIIPIHTNAVVGQMIERARRAIGQ